MNKQEYRDMMNSKWPLESPQAQNAFARFDKAYPLIWRDFALVAEGMFKHGKPISLSAICENSTFARNQCWLREEAKKYNVITMYANKLIQQDARYDRLFPKNMKRVRIAKSKIRYKTVPEVLGFHKRHPERYFEFCRLAIMEIHRQRDAKVLYWTNLFADIRARGFIVNDRILPWYGHSFMTHYKGSGLIENVRPLPTPFIPQNFELPIRSKLPAIAEAVAEEEKAQREREEAQRQEKEKEKEKQESAKSEAEMEARIDELTARINEIAAQAKATDCVQKARQARFGVLETQCEITRLAAVKNRSDIGQLKDEICALKNTPVSFWQRVKRFFGGKYD